MLRAIPIAVLLSAVALSAGCSKSPEYEVLLDAKGSGTATRVSYQIPGESAPQVEKDAKLPWHSGAVPNTPGTIVLEVTAAKGSRASCRIEVEGKEMAKKEGRDGETVRCEKTLTELPDNR